MSVVAEAASRRWGGVAQTNANAAKSASASVNRCLACPVRRTGPCASAPVGALAGVSRVSSVPAGGAVAYEGDEADSLYFVIDGMLKIYKSLPDGRRQTIGFAAAGDVIGLSVGETYCYTSEAVMHSSVCRIPRRSLDALRVEHPAMQKRLYELVSTELLAAQDQMLLLGRKTAVERICSFLLTMADRYGDRSEQPVVALPMLKGDVGCYLGLRPETVSRTFRRIEEMGAIRRVANECIQIIDRAALASLATWEGSVRDGAVSDA